MLVHLRHNTGLIRGTIWPNGAEPLSRSRARGLGLSDCGARRLLARVPNATTAVRRRRHGRPSWPSSRRATRPKASAQTIASLLQQDYPGAFSVMLVDDQSSDGTADVARQAAAAARRPADRRSGRRAAGGLDRQAVGDEARRRRALIGEPAYLLFTDADIVYDARHAHAPRLASAGERARAQFADGAAPLRELRRARVRSGLHLLFPDALPVRLGERPRPRPPRRRRAAACWCAATRSTQPAASRPSAAP